MPVDPDQYDRVAEKIKKKYGDEVIHAGDKTSPVPRLSFGSPELDYVTGGGYPWGRWGHFYGGYSSSKSLTCWRLIKEAQAQGKHCVYYNVEKQYDKVFVKSLGVKVTEPWLRIVEGSVIEGVGDALESLLGVAHVHVIDSTANAVALDALRVDVADQHMALGARTWGRVLLRAHERFDHMDNIVILVNQVRDAFGSSGESPPGGKFIDFISSMSLHFKRTSWLFRDQTTGILDPDNNQEYGLGEAIEPSGMEYTVRVVKSRVGRPERMARLRYDFASGEYDTIYELAKAAKHFGVVNVKAGGNYTMPDGKNVKGFSKFREALAADTKLQKQVRDAMLKAA